MVHVWVSFPLVNISHILLPTSQPTENGKVTRLLLLLTIMITVSKTKKKSLKESGVSPRLLTEITRKFSESTTYYYWNMISSQLSPYSSKTRALLPPPSKYKDFFNPLTPSWLFLFLGVGLSDREIRGVPQTAVGRMSTRDQCAILEIGFIFPLT